MKVEARFALQHRDFPDFVIRLSVTKPVDSPDEVQDWLDECQMILVRENALFRRVER